MLSEDEYFDDSGDPELAFVRLVAKFRAVFDSKMEGSNESWAQQAAIIEYMNHVLAAADAYQIDGFEGWRVPSHRTADLWDLYRDFAEAVDHYTVKVRIAAVNGRRAFSLTLSAPEKQKVRHYVEQIKEIIDKSSLETAKKEALYDKINDFLAALDKDRTTLQSVGEFVTGSAAILGEAAENAEPAWKWVRQIAAFFGVKVEEAQQIPPPRHPKRIEGPRKRLPPPAPKEKSGHVDDDIPF